MCLSITFLIISRNLPITSTVLLLMCHLFQFLFQGLNRTIGLMSRVFTNGRGYRGSIPGRVTPKTQKMVLDTALLNTQHYKVRIKGKVE